MRYRHLHRSISVSINWLCKISSETPFRLQLYHPIQLRLKMPSTTLKMLLNTNVIGHFQIYHVRLVLYSTLVPPTSAIVRELNFSRSQPDMGVSLWVLPLQNRPPVKNIWSGCCGPGSGITVWRQPEAPFLCIRPIPSELLPSQFRPRGCKQG